VTTRVANTKQRGAIMAELIVAIAVLVIAMLPLSFSALSNAHELRTTYQKVVTNEILDGEIEILAAGGWQQIAERTNTYQVHANAATNLPPGKFQISRTGNVLRLEWKATKKLGLGTLSREVKIK
jgi:hypothetical protein